MGLDFCKVRQSALPTECRELVPAKAGIFRLQTFAPWKKTSWKTKFDRVILHDHTKNDTLTFREKLFF